MRGIDISNWQAGIIPSALGIDFCICKATEGIGYTDPTCDGFVTDCMENGLLWGFYHFARENEPEAEAEWFYNECRNYFNHGIPVLDYETSNANNIEWCERFMTRLHDLTGVWAMLYISASRCGEYENSWLPDKCGLWVAGYPYANENWTEQDMPYNIYPWPFAAIWQFTSSLMLDGWSYVETVYDEYGTHDENRNCLDGNIAYMNANAWAKYANSTDTPQPMPEKPEKSIDDLVMETLLGEYGNGEDRKRLLGDRYEQVQARINELYAIADEVIDGKWGNGWNREQALNGAGYPYSIVQKIVNDKLA